MILAKDIMTKEVLSIKPATSIIEAIDTLLENKISGLPVVDDEQNLVGIVSEKDLLHILFKDNINVGDTVEEYMSKKVNHFTDEASVYDICGFFLQSNNRRVPIVNQEGQLVGVVSRRDVLKVVLSTVLSLEDNR